MGLGEHLPVAVSDGMVKSFLLKLRKNYAIHFNNVNTFLMKFVGAGVKFYFSSVFQLKSEDTLVGDVVLAICFKIAFLHPVDHGFAGHLKEVGGLCITEILSGRGFIIHKSLSKNVAKIIHL